MEKENIGDQINRRKILRTTGAAVGGGLTLGATGTAAASDGGRGRGSDRGCAQGNKRRRGRGSERCGSVQEISTDGDTIITLVEVLGEKFLFREAAAYRNADDVSALSDDRTYEATESGHPVEFGQTDSSVSASDLDSAGAVQVRDIEFTPENFIGSYDVDYKLISDSCGDIAFSSHHALEFHFKGGGGFSSIGVAGIAGCICYAAGASASIPTSGLSGLAAGGICSGLTEAVDQLVDVDMIPNHVELSVAFWDQDETNYMGLNTSPTIAVGLEGDWGADYGKISKIGEYDINLHLGL
ncbi:MAG: hypothetical protein V5A34_09540 [Halapricum sp.]